MGCILHFSVMPNHVHMLISMIRRENENGHFNKQLSDLSENMKIIKGYSAREINKISVKTGSIWMREYYDTMINTEKQICKCVLYILRNPVKAGLTDDLFSWHGNYYNEEKLIQYTGLKLYELDKLYP